MYPKLLATTGVLTGTVVPLPDGQLSIGRDSSNDLRLADPLVSRTHCILRKSDESYELLDLDSHNGTFVEGVPVRVRRLRHGDHIRVGNSEFVLALHDEAAPGTPFEMCVTEGPTRAPSAPVRTDTAAAPPGIQSDLADMARIAAALIRIIEFSNSIRDLEALQRELLRVIFEVVPAENGAIVLLDAAGGEPRSMVTRDRSGASPPAIRLRRDLIDRALWERSATLANSAPPGENTESALCVPLLSVQRALGVLYLTSAAPSPFGQDDVLLLGTLSRILAITLENRMALHALRSENEELRREIHTSTLIGESRKLAQVRDFVDRVAPSESTVLVRGESGTGKELVARAIHHQSPRAERPFIAINCAAIPEALLESELFGHEKGAFTGAVVMKKGKFEIAENGTLFLDEVGELAPLLQAKLLRVLQQREFERLGGVRSLPFSARVVAATNRNLEQAIRSGEFRQDLYYRLNVVSVTVPPLRDRHEDIPLLALYFARKHAVHTKRPFKGISREARNLLLHYSWPGNVRELENAIEHALVLGVTEEILPEDLPDTILEQQVAGSEGPRYHSVLNEAKREVIVNALREAGGNYPSAAQALGIHPKYLHRLARNLRIKPPQAGNADRDE